MIFGHIKKPIGRTPEAIAMQRLVEAAESITRITDASGLRVNRTTQGVQIAPSVGGAVGTVPPASMYKVKDVWGDYLVCVTWSGTTEGTSWVYIAKEPGHRESLTAETIIGEAHTYTYTAGPSETWAAGASTDYNRTRVDVITGFPDENQRIVKPWTEDEIIFAIPARTGITADKLDADGNRVDASGHTVADDQPAAQVPISLLIAGRSSQWARFPA